MHAELPKMSIQIVFTTHKTDSLPIIGPQGSEFNKKKI